ncbi:MAG: (d)CMP kinase [Chloroflexi bacterium]|nr:(d)CMP kinase [Chloroflexota bacterium]
MRWLKAALSARLRRSAASSEKTGLPQVIAIDGPSAAGKSTVGREVAHSRPSLLFHADALADAIAALCGLGGLVTRLVRYATRVGAAL